MVNFYRIEPQSTQRNGFSLCALCALCGENAVLETSQEGWRVVKSPFRESSINEVIVRRHKKGGKNA